MPSPGEGALLPKENSLTRAGPEIIPDLLAAIERRYATREVIKRYSRFIPGPFHKPFGEDLPSGSEVHGYAAYRLGLMGEAASNAVPTLLELLKFHRRFSFDGDRARMIQALGFIGPPAREAAPSLVKELQNPSDWVKRTTARTLLQMGTVPSEAVPFLKRKPEHDGGECRGDCGCSYRRGGNSGEHLTRFVDVDERDTHAVEAGAPIGCSRLADVP